MSPSVFGRDRVIPPMTTPIIRTRPQRGNGLSDHSSALNNHPGRMVERRPSAVSVAAARELRDRYIEQINLAPGMLLSPSACGKYDVSRQLEAAPSAMKIEPVPMLEAA